MSEDASALPRNGCCNGQKMEDEFFLLLPPDQIFLRYVFIQVWEENPSLLSNWSHWMLSNDYIGTEQTGPHSASLLPSGVPSANRKRHTCMSVFSAAL